MNIFIILALIVLVIFGILYFKNKSTPTVTAEKALADLPKDKADLYILGLHPENAPNTLIYALTTCNHCRKTRLLLEENNVPFTIVYVDEYPKVLNLKLMDKIRGYNPRGSFPTVYLPTGQILTGYRETSLREALINDPTRTS